MKALEKTCKDRNIEFTAYNNHIRCLVSTLKVRYVKNENELLNNDEVSEVVSTKTRKVFTSM
jgi:hypothetical protein